MKRLRVTVVALLALAVIGLGALLALAKPQHGAGAGTGGQRTAGTRSDAADGSAKPSTGPRPAPIIFRPHFVGTAKVPLLVALHPSGDTPSDWRMETRFNLLAKQYGFEVAYLGSLPARTTPGAGPAWRKVDLPRNLSYISDEITSLEAAGNVDPKRVYVMGFSAGATMTYIVACNLSSKIAGIAAVSGAWIKTFPCQITHPMTVLEIIGTNDLIPIAGGKNGYSVWQVAANFRRSDGCGATPARAAVVGSAETQTWGPCQDTTAVALDLIVGGRHHYPGERYGAANPDTNFPASKEIWSFFMAHPGQ